VALTSFRQTGWHLMNRRSSRIALTTHHF